jgi:pimeloyl-ACP methyl ester carboxylesterase
MRTVAVIAAVSLALTGCSALASLTDGGNGNDGQTVPIAQLRVPMTSALRSYYEQKIDWQSCGKPYECAYIQAPLDWSDPGGRSIHLALIKHPASGKRVGALLVNPGGPGASGTEMVGDGWENAVDSAVSKRYDVIGFDPPGVGESSAVKCGGAKGLDAYLYGTVPGTIGSASWIEADKAKSVAFAQACKRDTGALLAHVDTITAAHDLDLIRATLGEKKLDYLGYSYGTYLGTVYAGLYPENVGRMVFDGPDDPWYGSGGGSDSQAAGFDDDLDVYLKSCLRNDKEAVGTRVCPFTGSFADASHTVEHELAAAGEHPIDNSDGRKLNAATLATAISQAMYDTSSWPELTDMFTQVAERKSTVAFELADEYNDRNSNGTYQDNLNEASQAIDCLEDGSSIDLRYDATELSQLRKSAPILGQYQSYSDLICAGWPYGPTPFPDPIHASGAAPIVLVGTTGDPATPYSGAVALAKQLDSAHLVTFHGEGHTAYDEGNACVDNAVDGYLIDGTVPAKGLQCH